jgi:hypothetical protein
MDEGQELKTVRVRWRTHLITGRRGMVNEANGLYARMIVLMSCSAVSGGFVIEVLL